MVGYFVAKFGWSVGKALEFVRSRRPEVSPKPLYLKQLQVSAKGLGCDTVFLHEYASSTVPLTLWWSYCIRLFGSVVVPLRLDDSDAPVLVTEPGWKDPCDTEEELVVRNTVRRGAISNGPLSCVHLRFSNNLGNNLPWSWLCCSQTLTVHSF
jgi:hypothetical protein